MHFLRKTEKKQHPSVADSPPHAAPNVFEIHKATQR